MEKLKTFISSTRNQVIIGLICGIILTITSLEIGLLIYFLFVLLRMNKKNCNLKIAQVILVINFIIMIFNYGSMFMGNIPFTTNSIFYFYLPVSIQVIYYVIMTLYFIKIFFLKDTKINNKVFSIISIVFVLYGTFQCIKFTGSIMQLTQMIARLFIIPYFYNYYNLLKEEKQNG